MCTVAGATLAAAPLSGGGGSHQKTEFPPLCAVCARACDVGHREANEASAPARKGGEADAHQGLLSLPDPCGIHPGAEGLRWGGREGRTCRKGEGCG